MSRSIHETAVVAPEAQVGEGVKIGPYAVIGPQVEIGPDTEVGAHVVIDGITRIGRGNTILPFSSIGTAPQDLKYQGEPTRLEIGDHNVIREYVTIHRGTPDGGGVTRVGSHCLLMAYTHVAHDCRLGDHVVMANGATLGGHVELGDHVVIGGLSAVHQFCKIGEFAFIGGMSGIEKDIPPYVKYFGVRGRLYGLNLIGLRRGGFAKEVITALRDAYRIIVQRSTILKDAIAEVEALWPDIPEVMKFASFVRESTRGIPMGEEEE